MKNILHFLFVLIFVLSLQFVDAQNYTMPSTGSTTITACGGVLLDPGGTGQYSAYCDGYITINPATPGCKVRISGNYHTESVTWDWIEVYDGTSSSGTMLSSRVGGTGTLDVTSQTGSLTIWFRSDGSGQYDGFAFDITCVGSCDCGGPYGVTAMPANGHVILSWTNPNAADISGYIIEYGPAGFTPGTGTTVYTTSTTYDITGLTNNNNYFFYVYFDCGNDHVVTTETGTMVSATPSNNINVNMPANGTTEVVMCSGHIYDSGGPSGNYSTYEDGSVIIHAENPWCQLTVSGSYYTESGYDRITILDGAGTGNTLVNAVSGSGTINVTSSGSSITIQFHSDVSNQYTGFDLSVSCSGTCTCGSHALTGVHLEAGNMGYNLIWNEATGDPSIQHYIIEYGLSGFTPGTGTTVTTTGSPYFLTGLTAGSTYDFYVWADCGDDGVITTEVPAVVSYCVPDAVACIDFSDLHSPNIHCTYGTFSNPYATQGVVDNGPASSSSRHTLHTTNEADPRTGGGLMTIPPCELYSVRLGNWNTGAEAESIAYDFAVDTTDADILLLKYAAVLEDPSHSSSEQPRFDFELLDQNGNRIDPTCGYASFIANASLGWHNTNSVLWKDWTYVGFDVSAYHGQTVRVRLTTYDCSQSGHYGYAYFTLNCKKRTIVAETCGEMLANTYTAPAGFNYAWYYEDQPNNILSTDQSCSIVVTGGHATLHCHVTFTGNSSCGFDLTTSLSSRYPLASCEPVRDSCTWSFDMHNTSTISFDGVNPSGTNEDCETAHWDFGDGTTSDEYNPTHEFPGPGTYNVTLIAGISEDACQDTVHVTIDLLANNPVITAPESVCQGDGATLTASGGNNYVWTVGGQTVSEEESFYLEPDSTATYTLESYSADGCLVTVDHEIVVNPVKDSTITAEICVGERYTDNGFNLAPMTMPGTFTPQIVIPNAYGCDSTVTLEITVKPIPNTSLGQTFNHCFEDEGDVVLRVPEADCDSYLWNTGATTQSITVSEGDTYSVTAVKDGCENNSEIEIRDVCPFSIYLPNCITPTNEDGLNDIFCLPSTKGIAEFHIYIFDRWGKLVFQSDDPHFQWDGSINGKIRSNNTYTWRIDLMTDGAEKRLMSGILTVL